MRNRNQRPYEEKRIPRLSYNPFDITDYELVRALCGFCHEYIGIDIYVQYVRNHGERFQFQDDLNNLKGRIQKHQCKASQAYRQISEEEMLSAKNEEKRKIQKRLDEIYGDAHEPEIVGVGIVEPAPYQKMIEVIRGIEEQQPGIIKNSLQTPFRIGMWVINITNGDLLHLNTEEKLSQIVYAYLDGERIFKQYV